MSWLSIIIPTLNEAENIEQTLTQLQAYRIRGHEVIVADGGSTDGTAFIAKTLADQVIHSEKGRARQMNKGASIAKGQILLFLHADTQLPDFADNIIAKGIGSTAFLWGRFSVRLSGSSPLFRIIESFMNWRSCISGIATGDQAIFVQNALFHEAGGFPDQPLMEDIALCKTLKGYTSPLNLDDLVTTSSRRWEEKGILKTLLLMWWLRLAYFCGATPQQLVKYYYP